MALNTFKRNCPTPLFFKGLIVFIGCIVSYYTMNATAFFITSTLHQSVFPSANKNCSSAGHTSIWLLNSGIPVMVFTLVLKFSVVMYYTLTRHGIVVALVARSSKSCQYMWTLKSKVVPYSITSVGHRADPGFLAVSPQVTLVINPVVGCR